MKKMCVVLAVLGGCCLAPAWGACPDVKDLSSVVRVNNSTDIDGSTIYFCKQDFAPSALAYSPTTINLLTGGNQRLSQGSSQQILPIMSSINFAGFSPASLPLNSVSANLPNVNGAFGSPSLFNFYTRVGITNNCTTSGKNEYDYIKNYLRNNANIFQASSSGLQTGLADSSSNASIATIPNALLKSSQSNNTLPVKISFYHANYSNSGQYFTSTKRFCWVGVAVKIDIDPNATNLRNAGDYVVNVGVQTL